MLDVGKWSGWEWVVEDADQVCGGLDGDIGGCGVGDAGFGRKKFDCVADAFGFCFGDK